MSSRMMHLINLLVLLLTSNLFIHFCSVDAAVPVSGSGSIVEFLPGFQGPLPFHLETGYIGVDESEDVQLYYYFVKSEGKPKDDPLVLWLNGGPGCSCFSGFVYEIGPIYFEAVEYNGNLPTLVLNPNTWTKVASIIFLDLPVGAGFSYGRTWQASQSDDFKWCDHANEFMRKFLIDYPEFISNPFYIGGGSYTGVIVPVLAQLISNGNDDDKEQFINLKGYILGNPKTFDEQRYQVPFSHGMGLIPDELYESLMRSCGGQYTTVDPMNVQCVRDVEAFNQCIEGIYEQHILEPECGLATPKSRELFGERRALSGRLRYKPSGFYCRNEIYKLSDYWNNDKSVQEALHIKEGSIREWTRCNFSLPFKSIIDDSRPYHANLSTKGYRSLISSGDHDMLVPFESTQAWIKNLNYSIIDDWRAWHVHGQIAGYTRTYANQMTFATVKGGGHTAPEYNPQECYAMFKRWISHEPL